MFKKREVDNEGPERNHAENNHTVEVRQDKLNTIQPSLQDSIQNTILKGSKLSGDIMISCDLELSGDVEGNITSEQNSNIIIKGSCQGNIKTRGGNVDIQGNIIDGDIVSGGNVRITGKFNGGRIEAKEKIYVNGEFNGRLESNEIEIGPAAKGKGELLYREYISISRGANVNVEISRIKDATQSVKKPSEKVVNLGIQAKESEQTGERSQVSSAGTNPS